MWILARNLSDNVQQISDFNNDDAVNSLLAELEKNKWRLQNITKNTPKSTADRAKVSNPNVEVELGSGGAKVPLDQSICSETQIISDIFNLNEIEALELVLTGDVQGANFDGLNRGLVSVVCYYDGHRLLANTLKTILEWNQEELPCKIVEFVNKNFVTTTLMKHLIQLQKTFSVASEFQMLMQPHVNGLGGSNHQILIRSMVDDIRRLAAESVYAMCEWAADKSKDFMHDLMTCVKSFTASDKLQMYHITAWTCIQTLLSKKCLLQSNYSASVLTECYNQLRNEIGWSDITMYGSLALSLAVAARNVALSPTDHSATSDIDINVDTLIDRSIQYMCFHFLRHCILNFEGLRAIPQQVEVVDGILKGFVMLFPVKMMELLRNGTDELNIIDEIKETKGDVSMTPQHEHFRYLLTSFSEVYGTDQARATAFPLTEAAVTQLSRQFCPDGTLQLCHFIELARRPNHAVHAVAFLQMLRDICRTKETANFIFDMFYQLPLNSEDWFSWNSFVSALRQYEKYFRQTIQPLVPFGSQDQVAPIVSEQELAGLIAWIQLAEKVARLDDESCQILADDRVWALIDAACSVVAAKVPIRLKGALLRLLASLARLKSVAPRVWGAMDAHSLCAFTEGGKLTGLIQELEDRECVDRSYECSLGMAHLLRALFSHPTLPEVVGPYIQFCGNSILAHMSTRSYNSVTQMWELAEVCMDALYWVILNNHAEARAVAKREPHVAILLQLLNDTPLYRTICWVLCEDSAACLSSASTNRHSSTASLAALRLLHAAVTRLAALRVAIRAADVDAILCSLEALLMSPLPQNSNNNILNVLFTFISQHTDLPVHALLCMQILRELSTLRPSLQQRMVELLRTMPEVPSRLIRTTHSVLDTDNVQYTVEDVQLKDNLDFVDNLQKVKGETARLLLEILADAVDSDPCSSNLCYQLFGFDIRSNSGQLYQNMSIRTGFHRLLDLFDLFIASEDPFSMSCSALFEPAFRLLRGLISVEAPCSSNVLRHLRTYDVIYRLATSPFMGNHAAAEGTDYITTTMAALSNMIAGNILHLVALYVSSLLIHGHFIEPQRMLRALLETVNGGADTSANETAMARLPNDRNVLFSLLDGAQTAIPSETSPPVLVFFDALKLQKLLDCCIRSTTWGVPLYDVEHAHFLLKREILALAIEDASAPTREMEEVLMWCTSSNARWMIEGAHTTLLSGCTALLNVISLFAPLPFFTNAMQVQVLRDAAFVVISVASAHAGSLANALCSSLHRICRAMCKLIDHEKAENDVRRSILSQVLAPLFELMVQPGERTLEAKMSLYAACRVCVAACYKPPCSEKNEDGDSQEKSVDETWLFRPLVSTQSDPLRALLDNLTQEIVSYLTGDIVDLPLQHKACPLTLLGDLLWEDSLGTRRMAVLVAKSGLTRSIVEIVSRLSLDFTAVNDGGNFATNYALFKASMSCLTRISLVDAGWQSLVEVGTVDLLAKTEYLVHAPKELFLQPTSLNLKGSTGWAFGECLDLVIHFAIAMAGNAQWKRICLQLLELILSQSELLCQLIRADVNHKIVDCATRLLRFAYDHEESLRDALDNSASLKMIRLHELNKGRSTAQPLKVLNTANVIGGRVFPGFAA